MSPLAYTSSPPEVTKAARIAWALGLLGVYLASTIISLMVVAPRVTYFIFHHGADETLFGCYCLGALAVGLVGVPWMYSRRHRLTVLGSFLLAWLLGAVSFSAGLAIAYVL